MRPMEERGTLVGYAMGASTCEMVGYSVSYHAQYCNASGNCPAIGTPSVVYVVYGRCNVLNDASRTNQQELEIGNTIVK